MTDQLAVDRGDSQVDGAPGADSEVANEPSSPPTGTRWGRTRRSQRISKWDRPPDPHDWRFFVGNLGKVLIATGLLLFGFVAYQLWGTGIETARAQNQLENQFEQLLAEHDNGTPEPTATPTPITAPIGDVLEQPDPGAQPPTTVDASAATIAPANSVPIIGSADIIVPIDLSAQAVEQDIPPIVRGDVLARLEIPRIDQTEYIVPGVTLNDLKRGAGHYPDTPLPGQLGNASIAGHRTTYGAPFFDVDKLRGGDELIVTMASGDRFVYEVTFVEVVSASDYWVVTTRDPNIAELTLTSCHPKYTARDRIVVHSLLNPAKSSNVGIPTFYELEPDDQPIPGDDPVLSADGIEVSDPNSALGSLDEPVRADDPEVSSDGGAVPGDEISDATSDGTPSSGGDPVEAVDAEASGGGGTATVDAPAIDAPIDAFSQGWFDDRGAFPQIALWGIALTIISLLSYRVSRRFRHDSIGFLVGIAPFMFVLYFFFQNINRLLPPGI